ncbi:facilitated trehalose transporter Tret1-like isoform X2 [Anoplophora glabripennis]|uniref:facilitated trehalose transporter Tret1-like isoform X2 n=1 Tax=Anoplophora glabripennis TaxID=217634 RepID=UPI0008756826|nr:facilitated trehalose transporter Tret1-like isoform X2 [Anoplophora glabripennis]
MPGSNSGNYYRVASNQPAWANIFIQWNRQKWNGNHQRLQTTDSPCISACTTATNLSSLGDFQSNSTINFQRKMGTLEENLRMTIPEIEPLQKKGDEEAGAQEETKPFSIWQIKRQLLTAVAVSWVSMIIGYSSAYTSPAQLSLEAHFNLEEDKMSWISSLMPLGALVGGLCGGTFIEYLGRKWTILLTNILFLTAWTVSYFAQNYVYLYVSRAITGASVGIASLTLPVYLAETIQPEVRGTLGLLPTAFGNIGILVCFLFGTVYQWQELALIGAILSLPFLVLIWFIPESPRFLVAKGKEEKSREALQWLRGSETDIDKEFHELLKIQKESDKQNESVFVLFSRNNLKLLAIVLGLMFFQQLSGINAVIFYTTKIFKDAGSSLKESICTTIVGVVNFVSTFIAAILIDRLGRKVLLYISSVSMIISLSVLGAYFFLQNEHIVDVKPFGWLPLIALVIYVLGFSLGFGPVPWLMMGEILPSKIRGPAASVSTAFNWTCTFGVTKAFLPIIKIIGSHYTFWIFDAIMVVGLAFTVLFVPETRGQSLADIERKLAGVKVRRTSSVANLKPMPSTF